MSIVLKHGSNLAGTGNSPATALDLQQRRRMLIALGVLVVALIVVLIKDRQFWFPPGPVVELPSSEPTALPASAAATAAPDLVASRSQKPVHQTPAKSKRVKAKPEVPTPTTATPATPEVTATNRTVLPPLEVEVVAGNQHRTLAASNNPVNVEMQSSPPADTSQASQGPAPEPSLPAAAPGAQVSMPPGTARRVSHSVEPDYPTLAKQMKVQGAVVLQALIDKSGNIQDLHVVSGPAILAAAAQEAVRQWHFKPYLQRGKAVETESRITVNFTISTY